MQTKLARFLQTQKAFADVLTAVMDWIVAMATAGRIEKVHILLVEDSSKRSNRVTSALRDSGIACQIHRVANLIEAMAYLRADMPYLNAPRPDFVILGASQEHSCCCELLSEVRGNPRFARLKTVGVRDSSSHHEAVGEAPIPFTCCDLDRVTVDRIGNSIQEPVGSALESLTSSYG